MEISKGTSSSPHSCEFLWHFIYFYYPKLFFLTLLICLDPFFDRGSLGLPCIFPFLSNPLILLLLRLSVPVVAVMVVSISIGIANLIDNLLSAKQRAQLLDDSDDSSSEDAVLIPDVTRAKVSTVQFPAMALLTSVSISVVRFFYFGTALAAHEYLFASVQHTGTVYVQNMPWMLYSEAMKLIAASIRRF